MKRVLVLLFFGSFVLLFMGCAGLKKEKASVAPGSLEPQAMLKFADIPVPVGLKLIPQQSYSFESGGVRTAVLKYQGKGNVEQVINFYKEQMPMYNWNLLNVVEYGERLMNFDRESETCIISLSPKGNSITMTVSLGPKSQMRKKSDRPLK